MSYTMNFAVGQSIDSAPAVPSSIKQRVVNHLIQGVIDLTPGEHQLIATELAVPLATVRGIYFRSTVDVDLYLDNLSDVTGSPPVPLVAGEEYVWAVGTGICPMETDLGSFYVYNHDGVNAGTLEYRIGWN